MFIEHIIYIYQLKFFLLLGVFLSFSSKVYTQDLSALEVVKRMDEQAYGGHVSSHVKMTIERPKWTRTMEMKSWSIGNDFSIILITSPAREKGISYLKREREMWNYQPTIDRVIKLPASMMSQSWMGSDFKNDDLVRQSSIVNDYTHSFSNSQSDGHYVIESIPNPDAPVVWGRVKMWIDKKNMIQTKVMFYDEDDDLVQTIQASRVKKLGDRYLATYLELEPADEPGKKTIMEYLEMDFKTKHNPDFFSIQRMKRLR